MATYANLAEPSNREDCMTTASKLLFVSRNAGKAAEFRTLLPENCTLLLLDDIAWDGGEIPEPFDTFEENAKVKALTVFEKTGIPCFADDSGLVVDALDGRPGIHSARYAGGHKRSEDNMVKVLTELEGITHRHARFVAVIAWCPAVGEVYTYRGELHGTIALAPAGEGGFGYDPIFIPDGFDQTLGQLPASIKNAFSHRSKAWQQFMAAWQRRQA